MLEDKGCNEGGCKDSHCALNGFAEERMMTVLSTDDSAHCIADAEDKDAGVGWEDKLIGEKCFGPIL